MRNCRVDALVDSKVVICAWEGQGSKKSLELTKTTKELFFVLTARNIQLHLGYLPSVENPADGPSRHLSRSDSRLSEDAWKLVESMFGGEVGHSFNLMALKSNVVIGKTGVALPYFSPYPSPSSKGCNLFCQDLRKTEGMSNPYVFPPFGLMGPVLKFLYGFKIPFTVVAPELSPLAFWWPELMSRCSDRACLGRTGDLNVLLAPSKSGFSEIPCPCPLWACRVSRFSGNNE